MISVMLAAALVLAQGSSAAPAVEKTKADPDAMVCKKERVVGSRMPSKVCMTNRQWEERRAQDRDDLQRQQKVMQIERGN